ncbi:capsular polysaccharide biosynthesis protein [Campylobacter sp. IFREMER_LSEM_CL1846]|uniref:capsular polysaccharide biosynthesis protein n=1 Tax=Campylobacter sp. IFREMER_LSEM_CL1846 TaxID=2911614 RepID=UPI0021E65009|nr:capsular polysaccharide biosynthesis protein [Campylobacter sp. IFREMER_LSEM_CL1846]HEC1747994.1 capsular polysaccharide biosynthesis protein [Campylobacter lari]MCV3434091.1 capsular polysaccharide biosynthesis protein [Campylobacter sp. IFREMER_LSEM_CL1846]HEC1769101.1 capsular polysaccharide biosynthesis protein [Campylobacter lari]HEC1788876.1 capsular polysaccharide biosynthesis protein [Campylobacter lari]HEC1795667.1 capsular polysaccharide biosynthesis protein [Campylobacter lari]
MRFYTTSKRLKENVKNFCKITLYSAYKNITKEDVFVGWGRKKSGLKAIELAKKHNAKFLLLEDGFLRSLNLGVENSPSFSIVKDDMGIYYDATAPSKLENILNTYEFSTEELEQAKKVIELIKKEKLSKYNNNLCVPKELFGGSEERVLIITQVANDTSLKFGLADSFLTQDIINEAIIENPNAKIYIKIHPDVLSGKKQSDFNAQDLLSKCVVIKENYNPMELLSYFKKVYTKTSGMGFEALMLGCECVCYGVPFYAGWGLTQDKQACKRRLKKRTLEEVFYATYILYSEYFNPYLNQKSDIFDTIHTLAKYKKIEQANSNTLYFLGFTLWKRWFMKPFFKAKNNKIIFLNSLDELYKANLNLEDKIFIWGKKYDKFLLDKDFNNEIFLVEDGFLRSVFLGSDLTRPFSLIIDSKGLYVDPSKSSDLEDILQNHIFDESLKQRAKKLIITITQNKFSKYNGLKHEKLNFNTNKKIILIPAQVEDDASMILGGAGYDTLKLLQSVRKANENAFIIFKPHPDVLSGNRKGLKDKSIILKYCDEIIENVSIDSAINACDEVHTITSTSGFDALLRGKKVVVYGKPFYAGWGLTSDFHKIPRRTRVLSLEELVAGVLILYPRYIHPKSKNLCEVELALDIMLKMQKDYFSKFYLRWFIDIRIYILRKIRRLIEFILIR